MPIPRPNTDSENCRSLAMRSFANPTFARSRYATMYSMKTKGSTRQATFRRNADVSMEAGFSLWYFEADGMRLSERNLELLQRMSAVEERQLHAIPGFLRPVNAEDHFNRPSAILFIAARPSIALDGSNQVGHHQRIGDL